MFRYEFLNELPVSGNYQSDWIRNVRNGISNMGKVHHDNTSSKIAFIDNELVSVQPICK